MQKGPFRDELGEEQDMKDYVKEELTKIWITLSSLSLHVSECQCKNITSSSILELNNEREKNVRLEDEISSKEKEISDLKETIAILKEKEKSFKKKKLNMKIGQYSQSRQRLFFLKHRLLKIALLSIKIDLKLWKKILLNLCLKAIHKKMSLIKE